MLSNSSPSVLHVMFGEATDGVHIYAEKTARARSEAGHRSLVLASDSDIPARLDHDAVHVHLTDRLIESDTTRWRCLLTVVRATGVPLLMTLHDLPQRGEGAARYRRRVAATRGMASDAHAVCVSSEHERRCAADIGIRAFVVPHPIFPPVARATPTCPHRRRRSLTVAGFVHPGKGILGLVDEIGHVGGTHLEGWHLRLVGDVAPDHRDHLDEIVSTAGRNGLPVVHTGPVGERRWSSELSSAGVAICSHLHVSASGSLLSWIAAGRRPLVSNSAFARELVSERPLAVRIVGDSEWRSAISESLRAPDASTMPVDEWRTPDQSVETFEQVLTETLVTAPRNDLAS